MKRIIVGFALTGFMAASAFAQVPVTVTTDAPAMANQIQTMAQWAQQIAGMKRQYDQMQTDYQQMVRTYQSTTGSRGMGQIMNDPSLRDYLPSDWQKVYDSTKTGGYSGLSGSGKSVYEQNRIYDACASYIDDSQRLSCEAQAVKASQDKGFAMDAYTAAKGRINQLDQLMGQIDQTQDPKAIAELQARMAAEQANVQNEQTKLQMYSMVAAAEEKVQQQRQRELNAKVLSNRDYKPRQPIDFLSQ
jgi:type IV secretion system protein VirB5